MNLNHGFRFRNNNLVQFDPALVRPRLRLARPSPALDESYLPQVFTVLSICQKAGRAGDAE